MICSFKDKLTEAVFYGVIKKGFPTDIIRRAQQLLTLMDIATDLNELRSPPGNRLERLAGSRQGEYSVRINQQWRICFIWTSAGPDKVEITDYH
ncbi:type II toxin-antitoxin system RelE/ParE family toxin [Phyllobacterium zundukense]|uniref:type II toxin-antitoxin system RelE/ParE family toxin n=1 Tax=Phyllobacterium zundukense TaxID=1867719 RepID=UPI002905692E|nr:type II toxin-antitoxin system RelE/ParE family toxin [Phyllobacterium zundukense]